MSIEYQKRQAKFKDTVGVDEAEALLEWLQERPSAKVDLSACTHLHPANLQVLLAAKTRVNALPRDADLALWLESIVDMD
jgi:hypothetical protein